MQSANENKEKIVLAFDPGFVNGCKLAVVDKNGNPIVEI